MAGMAKRIALIGFPCSGKTSLGQQLAVDLNYTWLDTDRAIEKSEGLSIPQIFAQQGEAAFRQLEGVWLDQLPALNQVVISTGGGLPCFDDHMARLKQGALTVYLEANFNTLYQRLKTHAPNHTLLQAHTYESLAALFDQRHQIYLQAHLRFSVTGEIAELALSLLQKLRLNSG